jgi:hypothetical protein
VPNKEFLSRTNERTDERKKKRSAELPLLGNQTNEISIRTTSPHTHKRHGSKSRRRRRRKIKVQIEIKKKEFPRHFFVHFISKAQERVKLYISDFKMTSTALYTEKINTKQNKK